MEETHRSDNAESVIRMPRTRLLQVVVFFCFLLSSSVPAWLLSVVMAVGVVLLAADPFCRRAPSVIMPGIGLFLLILAVGLAGSSGKAAYDVAKDVWYVGNALLTLLFGYLLLRRIEDLRLIFLAVAFAGVMVSLFHEVRFVLDPLLFHESLAEIRARAGTGYLISTLGVGIALGDLRFRLGIFPKQWMLWTVIAVCMGSIVLSLSRTAWLVLLTLAAVTTLNISRRTLVRAAAALVPAVVLLTVITGLKIPGEGTGEPDPPTFFQKAAGSFGEISIAEYDSETDINRYWRGFESYRAVQEYASGGIMKRILGKGFGTPVDLGFVMTLADGEFDRVPVLHNGYLYLLVKTGIVGLGAYLLYLVLLFRRGKALTALLDRRSRFPGLLLIALTIVMAETTMVIAGMFNKNWVYPATLLIGVLLAYSESVLKEEKGGRSGTAAASGM